jgi:hypothetical protein
VLGQLRYLHLGSHPIRTQRFTSPHLRTVQFTSVEPGGAKASEMSPYLSIRYRPYKETSPSLNKASVFHGTRAFIQSPLFFQKQPTSR